MSKFSLRITPKEFLIWATIEIIAIVSTFVIADVASVEYNMLFLLPLAYCLLNILFVCNYANKALDSFPVLLLHGFYFVRIVLAPLFWALSGSHYPFNSNSNMSSAIYLMIYEMFFVYIVMVLWTGKHANTTQQNIVITDKIFNQSKMLIFVIIIALCGLLVMNPNAAMLYRSGLGFFDYEFTGFTSTEIIRQYSGSLIKKFGIVTFRYVFNISRVVVPCTIGLMMKYKNKQNVSIIIATLISTVVLNFLIMDDTLAYSICYSLIIIVFMSRLLNKKGLLKKALIIASALALFFFVSRFILSQEIYAKEGISTNRFSYIAGVLQSYFSGFTNIGASLNMGSYDIFERWKYLIYEVLRGVPYASTLFGLDATSLGTYFNTVNGSTGQIVPLLGSSAFYFGHILSPMLSCGFVSTGLKANRNMQKSINPFKVISAITVSLYAILGVSMYSLEIVCVGFFCIALPIYLIGLIIK